MFSLSLFHLEKKKKWYIAGCNELPMFGLSNRYSDSFFFIQLFRCVDILVVVRLFTCLSILVLRTCMQLIVLCFLREEKHKFVGLHFVISKSVKQ